MGAAELAAAAATSTPPSRRRTSHKEPAALHHLRQRRRRQEHADRPAAVRVEDAASRTSSRRWRATRAKVGTQGDELDFALLVDGLAAEREQGITIDVAYRFFSTERRKFIVADTPGHEQYTRNMVTGASTADLAVILVDARKGVLTQTRRHSYLVSLLGIRHVVLAINKMDLVDYSPGSRSTRSSARLSRIRRRDRPVRHRRHSDVGAARRQHHRARRAHALVLRPDAAAAPRDASRSTERRRAQPFRMPVQWVNRPNQDFRGFAGLIVGGTRVRGRSVVRACPRAGEQPRRAHRDARTAICAEARGRPVGHADAGGRDRRQPRRPAGVAADSPAAVADQFEATIVWMSEEPMLPGRPYLMKIGTKTVTATITELKHKINVNTLEQAGRHEAGAQRDRRVQHRARPADRLRSLRREPRHRRLHPDRPHQQRHGRRRGCCTSRCAARRTCTGRRSTSTSRRAPPSRARRPACCGSPACPGAGKSTIANLVEKRLHAAGRHTYLLDGDNVRHGLNKRSGLHRRRPRREHPPRGRGREADGRRRADRAGVVHLAVPRRAPDGARLLGEPGEFIEVFVDTPLAVAEAARSQGPVQEGARAATSRTSPASTRPTSRRRTPRSASTPPGGGGGGAPGGIFASSGGPGGVWRRFWFFPLGVCGEGGARSPPQREGGVGW